MDFDFFCKRETGKFHRQWIQKNDLWLATTDGLLRRMAGKWINMDDNLMAYGLKRTYFTLEIE